MGEDESDLRGGSEFKFYTLWLSPKLDPPNLGNIRRYLSTSMMERAGTWWG